MDHKYEYDRSQLISSSLVKTKLHTKKQPPSLLDLRGNYEEELKIEIWKTIYKYLQLFSQYFF